MWGKWCVDITTRSTYILFPDTGKSPGIFLLISSSRRRNLSFCKSPEGLLYLITSRTHIYSFDPQTKVLSSVAQWRENVNWPVQDVSYIQDALWISTNIHGVVRYNLVTGLFEQYNYDASQDLRFCNFTGKLSHTDSYGVTELANNMVMSVTWNGYTLFQPDSIEGQVSYRTEIYNHQYSVIHRDLETRMISLYYDPQGLVWVGTHGGGVLVSDLRKQFFQTYYQDTHNEICGMTMDGDNYLWLATFHQGILRSKEPFIPSNRIDFESFLYKSGGTVNCILSDSLNHIWFGCNEPVLYCYDTKRNEYKQYTIREEVTEDILSVWSLYMDSQGRFWIGTNNGLYRFDILTGTFFPACTVGTIRAITEMNGVLWLGTTSGIIRYEPETGRIEDGFDSKAGMASRSIRSLTTSGEELFIGYTEGLGILEIEGEMSFTFYTIKEGLCNNYIGSLLTDCTGSVWIGSHAGITRYSKSTDIFYHYYISGNNRSGLMAGDFLFWGNNRNLTYFQPDKVKNKPDKMGNVVLTQLEVNNKPVAIGEKVNGQQILSKGISFVSSISLSDANKNFSLHFSDFSYQYDTQKYTYRLLPWQTEWILASEGDRASYTNLPAGQYSFEVKSLYADGSTGETTFLDITILPHWSQSFGFRLFVILCLSGFVGSLIHKERIKKRRKEQEKQLKHALEIARLEKENQERINRERESFFTQVSHELRTPLTLIKSPLQEIIQKEPVPFSLYDKLMLIYTHATSLSDLVDQLLYIQKIKAGKVKPEIGSFDLLLSLRKIVASFRSIVENGSYHFSFDAGINPIQVWGDRRKIESAVMNLVSNAFKYTPPGSHIQLRTEITVVDDKPYVCIEVKDNGPGISEEEQKSIFDSFITGKANPSFSTRMGIGLHIVKNTVDIHHGRIVLKSSPGNGSCFSVYLPLGREHFAEELYEPLAVKERQHGVFLPEEREGNQQEVIKNRPGNESSS
ncbi:MAG: hypothetical protein LIP01_09935 [Tannerellaceae bacterium]|nr:hypothetical protein [Tannerellaceae bacterium]